MTRIVALLGKELADLFRNRSILFPAMVTGAISMLLPFFIAIAVPYFTGERLSDSSDFQVAVTMYREQPATRSLGAEAAVQAWIFQQFLILLVMTPIAGAMSIAAYAVIGEKQSRTLEPLLATPISTVELLTAKVLGALLPAVAISVGCFAVYVALIAMLADPGVARVMLTGRSLAIVFALGPLAALAALQLAVCVSSRVNDSRSAQQIGALIILPVTGLFVAQISGSVVMTASLIASISAGLVVANVILMRIGVALFDREAILTRWK
jgi:ABC-2 type transport system permease protein